MDQKTIVLSSKEFNNSKEFKAVYDSLRNQVKEALNINGNFRLNNGVVSLWGFNGSEWIEIGCGLANMLDHVKSLKSFTSFKFQTQKLVVDVKKMEAPTQAPEKKQLEAGSDNETKPEEKSDVSNRFDLKVKTVYLLNYFSNKLQWQLSKDENGFLMPLPVSSFINQDFLKVIDQFKNDYDNNYFYLDELDNNHIEPTKHHYINKSVLNDAYQVYQSLSGVDLNSFDTFRLIKLI